MPKCNCAGQTCGCSIKQGAGIQVTGTGTATDPFVISRYSADDTIRNQIGVNSSTSILLTKTGQGTAAEPVVISAAVRLTAPNGVQYGLAVSNAGALSAVPV